MLNKIHDYNEKVNIKSRRLERPCFRGKGFEEDGEADMSGILREVNIKSDMPTVDDAIRRITYNIKNAPALGVTAIKFIHGYGASGKGGAIREEARKYLDRQIARSQIKFYIKGEDFSIFDESTRKAFAICDGLRHDSDLERHNNGVTIVIL